MKLPKIIQTLFLSLLFTVGSGVVCAQPDYIKIHKQFANRLVSYAEIGEVDGMPWDKYLQTEKIFLSEGSFDDLRRLCNDSLAAMNIYLADGKRYLLQFLHDSTDIVSLSYPADYRLILGTNMIDAEDAFENSIRKTTIDATGEYDIPDQLLQQIGQSKIYLLQGNTFLIPELSGNRYYVKDQDHYSLLYSSDYPCETMANLLTGTDISSALQISVVLVKNNFKTDTFTVPLRQLVAYCLSEGCTPYYGIISNEKENVVCELFMHNEMLGYTHIAKISFNPSVLDSNEGTINARMNCYIPLSNVKNIFKDDE